MTPPRVPKVLTEDESTNEAPRGFPGGSVVKNLPVTAEDTGSISGSGRSPGGGNGNTFQYSCLGNPTDRGAWRAIVHGVAKEQDTTEKLKQTVYPVVPSTHLDIYL